MGLKARGIFVGLCVLSLFLNAATIGFALYGIALYDECVANGYRSSYDVMISYYSGIPFGVLLLISSVFFTAAVLVLILVVARRHAKKWSVTECVACIALACIATCTAISGYVAMNPSVGFMQAELQRSASFLPEDYIENGRLDELTLDDLRECFVPDPDFDKTDDADEDYPVYIGRADCDECSSFEEAISPILSSDGVTLFLPTYYTSEDRDGSRSDEMYALLDEIDVNSVPTVLVVLNGEIIARWDDPLGDIDQIERYLRTGEIPSKTSSSSSQ